MKFFLSFALALVVACDRPGPLLKEEPQPSTASPSPSIGLEIPERDDDRALMTLRRDAFRREERFLEALRPGTVLAATRVEQTEINQGRWTIKELYQLGGKLFDHSFTRMEGLGTTRKKTSLSGRLAQLEARRRSPLAKQWPRSYAPNM